MPAPIPLDQIIGQRYGRLTIVDEAAKSNTGLRRVVCRCSCGIEKVVRLDHLRRGTTRSCGCLNREVVTTHGLSEHPLYDTWHHMVDRCANPANAAYKNYAARGIVVCARWLGSPENYIEDIETHLGPKPSPQHSVDRIDNNGNYELSNVRWALPVVQNGNKRVRKYAGKQPPTNNTSGIVGVTQRANGKWRARVQCQGKSINLGVYKDKELAIAARLGAEEAADLLRGRSEF